MENNLDFKGVNIKVMDEGTGIPVVLLHGYLESSEIWLSFSEELKKKFRIIRIDLPGHGDSGILDKSHTMDMMAETVRFVLDALFIDKCVIIGHSMGGYVSLAFADNYPERLLGYSLFHSTPFADTQEKRLSRNREIELVKQHKKDLIINTNIPKLFADDNHELLKNEIDRSTMIARKTSEEGIIAALEGMKLRPERSEIIKKSPVPFLLILGRKDSHIPYEKVKTKLELNQSGELMVLENSGHMGFVEEPEKSAVIIQSFVKRCADR